MKLIIVLNLFYFGEEMFYIFLDKNLLKLFSVICYSFGDIFCVILFFYDYL